MKRFSLIFNLNQLSFFLITLPYLAFNWINIVQSPFFSLKNLFLLFSFFLLIDATIKFILRKTNKTSYITTLLIAYGLIMFFYGIYFTDFIQKEINNSLNIFVRCRTILECTTLFFATTTILLFKKNKINYLYLNIFLLIFSFTTFISSIKSYKAKRNENFKNNFISIPNENIRQKSVILIITDEYTSPDDLYNIYKDSSIYNFSHQLSTSGWIVKKSFFSYETSTIHSLSSMFNFNLSQNSNYSIEKIEDLGSKRLIKSNIADSLANKNVKINNFGIFHIGKQRYLNRLYLYPTSFIETIFLKTLYYTLKSNTGDLAVNGIDNSFFPTEDHNKFIINHTNDSLKSTKNEKSFTYIHLYMPHAPMQYLPEFSNISNNNLTNYISYWNFTNQKLNILLNKLLKENKYKIILTGDHGYRNNKKINPHNTFTAFYGFSEESIKKIKSVQDLGSLIYCCF